MMASDVQTASVAQGAAGQTAVVAAAGAGKVIEVLAYDLALDAAGTLKFQSASTDLTGAMPVAQNAHAQLAANFPLLRTAANEALNITTATGKAFGLVVYRVVG